MLVITDRLTSGQVTFILRMAIQIISYGGIFLIGIIILGNGPRVALFATHDVLNRVVGKSTSTKTSLKWVARRVFRRANDPASSIGLLLALVLSLCYGLFVSLSDLGFIGFRSCTVAGADTTDFPGSIKSDAEALAAVTSNVINGTDPKSIRQFRCNAAHIVQLNVNVTERICTQWLNSTLGDPMNDVRFLNSTDSDVLMARYIAKDNTASTSDLDVNVYFVSTFGLPVTEPSIGNALGVFPHATGVRMIVGLPQLSPQQRVDIPKTLALEAEMGCMPLGTIGQFDTSGESATGIDFFVPDAIYQTEKISQYTGPAVFQGPLGKAADAIRQIVLPFYNTSHTVSNGLYQGINASSALFGWETKIASWSPEDAVSLNDTSFDDFDASVPVLGNCTLEVSQLLNISFPSQSYSFEKQPAACTLLTMTGSSVSGGTPLQGHAEFICATSTQVNMVAATIEVDEAGTITHNITRLPSDLNVVQADYFEVLHDFPNPGETTWNNFDPVYRYTLSDNPSGPVNHYIYQERSFAGPVANLFSHGSGNIGNAFPLVGYAMLALDTLSSSSDFLGLMNATYFSAGNFTSDIVTQWGGGVGASFIRNSIGYNGWAARGAQALTVRSLGGQLATCYDPPYAVAFLPLVLAAVFCVVWGVIMLLRSQVRASRRLKGMYGGLAPMIVTPFFSKPGMDTVLVWENEPEPHLKPVVDGVPIIGSASDTSVGQVKNDHMSAGDDIEK